MYTLNIGDLPVNAEVPALKPIRVIRPIPNGKYLEHTIINVKTEGDKIIVDIPQIELRHIKNIDQKSVVHPYKNKKIAKYVVCLELFEKGCRKFCLTTKNSETNPRGRNLGRSASCTKVTAYGWMPVIMQELRLDKSHYEFSTNDIEWRRNGLSSAQIQAILRLCNLAKRRNFFDKVKKSYWLYCRATIKSITN